MVIGSIQHKSIKGNKKTEMYDVKEKIWITLPDFPISGKMLLLVYFGFNYKNADWKATFKACSI